MRVLQLTKFYPPVVGGIESVVYELTEGLNASNIRTDVLCANERARTVSEVHEQGYQVTRAASLGKVLATSMAPALIPKLASMMRAYDVIHVHLPDPMTNLALRLTRPDAAIVIHWHCDITHQRIALAAYAPLQQWLLDRADAIVATSEAYWQASPWLSKRATKVHVIPIGIRDLTRKVHGDGVRISQRYGNRRIVFAVGRMVFYKGFDHLVDAAASLPADTVVVIGGTGPFFDQLQARVRSLGLQDRVYLPGRIPEDEIDDHFAAADVFCLPSTTRAEAFGVVLLEAMRAGKPIVASQIDDSAVPWVNQHGSTGFNVPIGDSGALSNALASLLADPALRQRFGQAGRRRYEECFTAAQMVSSSLSLYQDVVSRRNS